MASLGKLQVNYLCCLCTLIGTFILVIGGVVSAIKAWKIERKVLLSLF